MTREDLQRWLNAHGTMVDVDGAIGPVSREAIKTAFANSCAPAVTDEDIGILAARLGCTPKQIRAVALVESSGSGFDHQSRPKILFERHKFWQLTGGKYPVSAWNDPKGGGYSEDSWNKLTRACGQSVDAAFAAASWGKFQVLGMHWETLGYPSPLEMAYSTVVSEAGHYEMLARYIEHFGLKVALQKLSTNPADNELFARLYNGPQFRKFRYDEKLAGAMK